MVSKKKVNRIGERKKMNCGDYATITAYRCTDDIDVMFVPVNGLGNNMNKTDAKRFAEKVNPKIVVPYHVGMFDEMTADDFDMDNKVIPEIYKEIKL